MKTHKMETLPKASPRRRAVAAALAAVALTAILPPWGAAHANPSWPSQPIRLVVPFPPGGSVDTVARTLGQALQDALGQPVIIENKPGASSVLGARYVKQAAPDCCSMRRCRSPTPCCWTP
jgi:tripartite-type tricarboxylate transporter receptor subunit TctC